MAGIGDARLRRRTEAWGGWKVPMPLSSSSLLFLLLPPLGPLHWSLGNDTSRLTPHWHLHPPLAPPSAAWGPSQLCGCCPCAPFPDALRETVKGLVQWAALQGRAGSRCARRWPHGLWAGLSVGLAGETASPKITEYCSGPFPCLLTTCLSQGNASCWNQWHIHQGCRTQYGGAYAHITVQGRPVLEGELLACGHSETQASAFLERAQPPHSPSVPCMQLAGQEREGMHTA